jgi:ATP-dependent DNA helicase RecQ
MVDFCESGTCRRKILLEYFGETYNEPNCGNCDTCLDPKETIDGTIIAQKIVSCVSQIDERFGINYIADILCGSRIQKIIRNRHDTVAAHGTGKEYSKKQWQVFARELVQLGYLLSEGDQYPIIKLTQDSNDILSGTKEVLLTKPEEKVKIIQKDADGSFNHDLFEILRSLRKKLADDSGMPPYIIFHDSSLVEMATHFPRSRPDFRTISGVGEHKLEKYGELFLKEIAGYCEDHNIESKPINIRNPPTKPITSTMQETLELCKQDLAIEEIARKRNLTTGTIVSHIGKLILSGEKINIDKLVDTAKQKHIIGVMSIIGSEKIAPIKEELGDDYTYEEIYLVRTYKTIFSQKIE